MREEEDTEIPGWEVSCDFLLPAIGSKFPFPGKLGFFPFTNNGSLCSTKGRGEWRIRYHPVNQQSFLCSCMESSKSHFCWTETDPIPAVEGTHGHTWAPLDQQRKGRREEFLGETHQPHRPSLLRVCGLLRSETPSIPKKFAKLSS